MPTPVILPGNENVPLVKPGLPQGRDKIFLAPLPVGAPLPTVQVPPAGMPPPDTPPPKRKLVMNSDHPLQQAWENMRTDMPYLPIDQAWRNWNNQPPLMGQMEKLYNSVKNTDWWLPWRDRL